MKLTYCELVELIRQTLYTHMQAARIYYERCQHDEEVWFGIGTLADNAGSPDLAALLKSCRNKIAATHAALEAYRRALRALSDFVDHAVAPPDAIATE